jgi:hypothetical protein
VNLLTIQILEDGTAISNANAGMKGFGDAARSLDQSINRLSEQAKVAPAPPRPPAPPDPRRVNPDLDEALGYAPTPKPPSNTATMPLPPAGNPPPFNLNSLTGTPEPSRVDVFVTNWPDSFRTDAPRGGRDKTNPEPPQPPPPPKPETYGFADVKDRLEGGERYGVEPPPDLPPRPPRGEPVDEGWYKRMKELEDTLARRQKIGLKLAEAEEEELRRLRLRLQNEVNRKTPTAPEGAESGWSGRPVGKEMWEKWKPENLLNDFKGMLPGGIGNKLGEIKGGFQAGGEAAAAAGESELLGAAAGAVAAAGPVVALAVAKFAADKMAGEFQKVERNVLRTGAIIADLAGNDHFGMMMKATDAVAEHFEELPIVGKAVAAEFRMLIAPLKAYQMVTQAFLERGRELEAYNGRLAVANATADIRTLESDIKEADRIGPDLARLTDATSRSEKAMRDIWLPIKEAIVKILVPIAEGGAVVVEGVAENVTRIATAIEVAWNLSPMKLGLDALQSIEDLVTRLLGLEEQKDNEVKKNALLREFERIPEKLAPTPRPQGAQAGARDQRFNTPIMGQNG